MYATHHHDLFYITMKYHQNIPNVFPGIEQTRNGWMDARLIATTPELLSGDKKVKVNPRSSFEQFGSTQVPCTKYQVPRPMVHWFWRIVFTPAPFSMAPCHTPFSQCHALFFQRHAFSSPIPFVLPYFTCQLGDKSTCVFMASIVLTACSH